MNQLKKIKSFLNNCINKITLFFARTYISTDFGSGDKNVTMVWKKVRGKLYLIDQYESN
jgi:hypothetical protein